MSKKKKKESTFNHSSDDESKNLGYENESKICSKKNYNFWMISSILLAVLVIIILTFVPNSITGRTIITSTNGAVSETKAGDIVLDLFRAQGGTASVLNVEAESGLYRVDFIVDGQQGSFYLTLDGNLLLLGNMIPINELMQQIQQQPQVQQSQQLSYSIEDLEEISKFVGCLADFGMVVYGNAGCPACRQFVEFFGGYDIVSSIYVECSEQRERCNEEAKTGYVPEVQLNGEVYQGVRDFEAFSQATGCPAPIIS